MRKSTSELGYNRVDGAGRPEFEFDTDRDWGRLKKSGSSNRNNCAVFQISQNPNVRVALPDVPFRYFQSQPWFGSPYIPARGRRTISPYSRTSSASNRMDSL